MTIPSALKCKSALVILVSLIAQPIAAAPPIMPILSVSMDPPGASVTLARTEAVTLNFTGTVEVTMNRFASMDVTIECLVEPDWAVNWSPGAMTFSQSGSRTFICVLTVNGSKGRTGGNIDVYVNGTTQYVQLQNYKEVHVDAELLDADNETLNSPGPTDGGILGSLISSSYAYILLPSAIVATIIAIVIGRHYLLKKRRTPAQEIYQ